MGLSTYVIQCVDRIKSWKVSHWFTKDILVGASSMAYRLCNEAHVNDAIVMEIVTLFISLATRGYHFRSVERFSNGEEF